MTSEADDAGRPGATGGTDDAEEPGRPRVSEDTKARFREALERKRAGGRHGEGGPSNSGAVHGSETMGGGRRTFRRRSGPS